MTRYLYVADEYKDDYSEEHLPFRNGKRMTNKEKLFLLRIIFEWETAEDIANHKHPIAYTRELLKDKYNINVPYNTLYNFSKSWRCEYDENRKIKCIYKI